MKTVRFTQVVEQSGRPHVHSLWVAPEKDPEFARACKADRVMTIEPTPGGKADVGSVGFVADQQQGNLFLIFPRSLKPFAGTRIVGIKFDLVDQPPTLAPSEHQVWMPTGRRKKPPHARSSPSRSNGHPRPRHIGHSGNAEFAAASAPEPEPPPAELVTPPNPRKRAAPPPVARTDRPNRAHRHSAQEAALVREVRAALAELRAGKTVAAYHRLERAAKKAQD